MSGKKRTGVDDDFVRTIEDDDEVAVDDDDDEAAASDGQGEPRQQTKSAAVPAAKEKGKSKSQLKKEKILARKAEIAAAKANGVDLKKRPVKPIAGAKKSSGPAPLPVELNPDFQFDVDASFSGSRYANAWDFTTAKAAIGKSRHAAFTTVDEKIEKSNKDAAAKSAKLAAKKVSKEEVVEGAEKKKKEAKPKDAETEEWSGSGDDAENFVDASDGSESDSEGADASSGDESGGSDDDRSGSGGSSDEEIVSDGEGPVVDEVNNDFGSDDEPETSEDEDETDLRPLVANGRRKADDSDSDDDGQDVVNDKRKAQFFEMPELEPQEAGTGASADGPGFNDMNLSRPIMRAIASLGFTAPTLIQQHAIPTAMLGKDICASAVTGSGKTAAFVIPILERLLFRPKNPPMTRVLILVPTRELGIQCHSVATNLAKFTDIKCALCVGGLSTKNQEMELRKRPDVVIATPGRLIDHVRNSVDFTLDSIEILVIDEADRILEDGFKEELAEIISFTSKTRQTMLFSATMTDSVDDLVKLSLNRPVRLFVNNNRNLASGLVQEFIRIRAGRNDLDRAAILASLVMRTYKTETIIFFGSKAAAHQMKIIFGLLGLKAAELHGDLTQLQRLEALEAFRDHKVDFLLATDLASRGLDIAGIRTVINYDMPRNYQQYVHRVGRTARAQANGRFVFLGLFGPAFSKVFANGFTILQIRVACHRSRSQDPQASSEKHPRSRQEPHHPSKCAPKVPEQGRQLPISSQAYP